MIKKRILAMITTLIFVFATVCTPVSFAGVGSFGDMSTNPNATSANASDPNASDPNASDPNASDPNASDPNASDPNAWSSGVMAEVSYYYDGELVTEEIFFYESSYAEAYIPYEYDRNKDVKVKVFHLNGTITKQAIKWRENQWGEVHFYSEVEDRFVRHSLDIYVDGPSGDAECEIFVKAYDSYENCYEFSVDSYAAAKDAGKTVTIPYGHNARVELYVTPYDKRAKVEDFYGDGEEEQGYILVSAGATKSFTVVSQSGEEKTYTLNFEKSYGTSADVELSAGFYDLALEDSDYGSYREIDIAFGEEQDGVKVADVVLPAEYDDAAGINLWIKNQDGYITDIGNETIFMDGNTEKTVTYEVTSPNGNVTKTYQINFVVESDEVSAPTGLNAFNITYTDKTGEAVQVSIDPEDASDEDGAVITIPEGIITDDGDEYYVNVYAALKGYGYICNSDTNADSYNSDCGMDYIKYDLSMSWRNSVTLKFDVMSSDRENITTYKVRLNNGTRSGSAKIDEVWIDYWLMNDEQMSDYLWLDEESNEGFITLQPYDDTKDVVLMGTGADGSEICVPVVFDEGENEATITFTSKSPDGANELTYTVTVAKPQHPYVTVISYDGKSEWVHDCEFSSDNHASVTVPYSHNNIDIDVTLLDGSKLEEQPEIVWESEAREDEHDPLYGQAQFEDNGITYTIDITSEGISSNKDVYMQLWCSNGYEKDGKYIQVSSEEASTAEGAVVTIPYGCEDNAYFYINEEYEYCSVDLFDENGEPYNRKVTPGETRVYTVTAQDGSTKDYKVSFVESDGNSTDVRISNAEITFTHEEKEYGYFFYRDLEFEEIDGVMVANIYLPCYYNESGKVKLELGSDEFVNIDKGFTKTLQPAVNGESSYGFTVTSPNGEVEQEYVVNFPMESEEAAASTELGRIEIRYTDENGNKVVEDVDLTKENDGRITVHIPENANFNEPVYAANYNKGYTRLLGSDMESEGAQIGGMGDWDFFETAYLIDKEHPAKYSFDVVSSNGENSKTYIVSIVVGVPHDCVWDEEYTIDEEPTCTEEGLKSIHCSICDATKDEVVLERLSHQYSEWIIDKEATCTKDGLMHATCSMCETVIEQDILAEHDYQILPEKKATCTEDGHTMGIVCGVCDQVFMPQIPIAAVGEHKVVIDKAVDVTCNRDGLTEGSHCSVCGEVLVEQEKIESEGHTFQTIPGKDATCMEDGLTTGVKCSACDTVFVPQIPIVAAGEHKVVVDRAVEPTCTKAGKTEGSHCSVCGIVLVEQERIEAEGHNVQLIPEKPATCIENGLTAGVKCVTCESVLLPQMPIVSTGQHTVVVDKAVAATCTKSGLTEGKHCSVCDEVLVAQKKTEAKGHSYEAVVTEPTCIEKGYTTHTCSGCGDSYKDTETEKGDHTVVIDPAVEATCMATGLTAGKHCSVCDKILVKQEVVEKAEHQLKVVFGKDMTCTEDGLSAGAACTVCDKLILPQIPIVAPGHDAVTDEAVAPTCTETGLTEGSHCAVCSEILVAQEVVAATGHTEEIIAAVEPTCTETGLTEGSRCTVCNETLVAQGTVAAKGHDVVIEDAVKASFGTEGLTAHKSCAVCNVVLQEREPIPALAVPKLSGTGYAYNGKARSPRVTVTDVNGNTALDSNGEAIEYTYTYKTTRKNVGSHGVDVTISANDHYEGTYTVYFTINPAAVAISSVTAATKAFTVKWTKPSSTNLKQMEGYQIMYSTSKDMTDAVTVTITGTSAVSKKITGLKAKTGYYVQLRAYKGDRYSKWSTAKYIKTK